MKIRWVYTKCHNPASPGEWLIRTENGKSAYGEWWNDGYDAHEVLSYSYTYAEANMPRMFQDHSKIPDVDLMLNCADFWQGASESLDDISKRPNVGIWDGTRIEVLHSKGAPIKR
jgi:hypothetical protein